MAEHATHSNQLGSRKYDSRLLLVGLSFLLLTLGTVVAYATEGGDPTDGAGVNAPSHSTGAMASPYATDALTPLYQRAAKYILAQTGHDKKKGYCFVFGAGKGRLAYELARESDLTIFGMEEDEKSVNSGRSGLLSAHLYGQRIVLHNGSLDKLRYSDHAAALVVSDTILVEGTCPGSAAEMFRMVRPDGGVALIGQPPGSPVKLERAELERWLRAGNLEYSITEDGNGLWARIDRGPLPGAGQWTKMWADLGNTACSGDERITDNWRVLWFGQPGPRVLVERHARPMTDLYMNGKWVIPGAHRVICVDAYNGARLWEVEVPDSSRVGINSDAGWVTMTGDHVYVVSRNNCMKLDADTGKLLDTFHNPTEEMDWGYIAVDGTLLFGSEQVADGSLIRGVGGNHWRASHGDFRPVITSKHFFCIDARDGKKIWSHETTPVIANPTICISQDAVFFIESHAPEALSDTDGRVSLETFTRGESEHLVKLDRTTGECLWRTRHELACRHSLYLSYASGILLASGARTDTSYVYDLKAFRAGDGALLWEKTGLDSRKANDSHGYQDKHPMIVGDRVYFKYGSFDLHTGDSLGFTFRSSNCTDFAASATHFFSRNGGCASIYSIAASGRSKQLSTVIRPGCYIGPIPAGGLIMLPALSSGCTCDYPIQASVVWQPR